MIAANVIFDLPAVEWSQRDRSTWQEVFAEVIAASGLLLVKPSGRAARRHGLNRRSPTLVTRRHPW